MDDINSKTAGLEDSRNWLPWFLITSTESCPHGNSYSILMTFSSSFDSLSKKLEGFSANYRRKTEILQVPEKVFRSSFILCALRMTQNLETDYQYFFPLLLLNDCLVVQGSIGTKLNVHIAEQIKTLFIWFEGFYLFNI